MVIQIGKKRLKQIDGSTADDITFKDLETDKEITFDEYVELIKQL
jgi:hypothetical protein